MLGFLSYNTTGFLGVVQYWSDKQNFETSGQIVSLSFALQ